MKFANRDVVVCVNVSGTVLNANEAYVVDCYVSLGFVRIVGQPGVYSDARFEKAE